MSGDLHVHLLLDGENFREALARHRSRPDEVWIRRCLAEYRLRGIDFLRDGGDRLGVSLLARGLAPEYGIDYRCPAFAIHKEGHYGAIVGKAYGDHGEYHTLLREAKAQRADFIKLMISGLIDFSQPHTLTEPPLPPEEIRYLIHAAHDMGFAVMVHANGDRAVLPAVEAEVESVEHGAFLSQDCLKAMGEKGTLWVPTLATVGNLIGRGRFPDAVTEPLLRTQMEKISNAHSYGVRIGQGSDAGAWQVPHGQGTLDEKTYLYRVFSDAAEDIIEDSLEYVRQRFRCPVA